MNLVWSTLPCFNKAWNVSCKGTMEMFSIWQVRYKTISQENRNWGVHINSMVDPNFQKEVYFSPSKYNSIPHFSDIVQRYRIKLREGRHWYFMMSQQLRLYHGKATSPVNRCHTQTASPWWQLNPGQPTFSVLVTGTNYCATRLPWKGVKAPILNEKTIFNWVCFCHIKDLIMPYQCENKGTEV